MQMQNNNKLISYKITCFVCKQRKIQLSKRLALAFSEREMSQSSDRNEVQQKKQVQIACRPSFTKFPGKT